MCPPIEPMSALMIERVIFMKFSVGYDVEDRVARLWPQSFGLARVLAQGFVAP